MQKKHFAGLFYGAVAWRSANVRGCINNVTPDVCVTASMQPTTRANSASYPQRDGK